MVLDVLDIHKDYETPSQELEGLVPLLSVLLDSLDVAPLGIHPEVGAYSEHVSFQFTEP
jgi:hypothetical protein